MPAVVEPSRQNKYDAQRSHTRANIAPIPKPVDPARRLACGASLRLFLETYFPRAFKLKWSDDHLEVIEKTQAAIVDGQISAIAMPRGSGKTTIHQRAAIWAINYGYSPYVFLVSADADKAKTGLRSIKTEYEFNPLLYADFPEICKPIRELQGVSMAAKKQHVEGVPTLIDWTVGSAQLPYVDGSIASGARIGVGGITGAARGAQITLPDGEVLRPSLVLVDDFQTRESAASKTQCKTRLDTLTGDLLGMRGPGEKFSMLATVTVIYRDDAADQLLDRKKYPEFHGTRKKLVYAWPTDEKKWEEYAELRRQAFREDRPTTEADNYYLSNREAMDAGAVVAWPERKLDEEHSAIQHAFNLKITDPDAFEAEYQNEPVAQSDDDINYLSADQIAEKLSNRPKEYLPETIQHVTAAIDVQGNSLWWAVMGWGEGFTGYIVDYGCFPDQKRRFYTQRELQRTFATEWPELNEDQAIYRALGKVVDSLVCRRWALDGGTQLSVSRILVDEGYKESTIHLYCKEGGHSSLLIPAKGMGIKAGSSPLCESKAREGEKIGWHWRHRPTRNDRRVRSLRHVLWDTYPWKSFLQERLATPPGGGGCVTICGDKSIDHRLLAQHLTSEFPTKTEGRGRPVIEWTLKPGRPDNHWLDCLGMNCVAASMLGVELMQGLTSKVKKKKLSLAEYQNRAKGR